MYHRSRTIAALVGFLAAVSGCSQSGGSPSEPIYATATPAPMPTAAPTPTFAATPSPEPALTGNGEFIFSAETSTSDVPEPGPYVLTGVGGQYDGVEFGVTERFYAGVPAVTSCSSTDASATCTPPSPYDATCKNAATTITVGPYHTGLLAGFQNPTEAPLTCTFVFADPYGHSTNLTVTTDPSVAAGTPTPQPAATGDGKFSFDPPAPYVVPSAGAYVFPTEGNYHGQFKVTGCTIGTPSCIDVGFGNPGLYVCNAGPTGAQFGPPTNQRALTDFFGVSANGSDAALCSFIITDEFGHSATYSVTGAAPVSATSAKR